MGQGTLREVLPSHALPTTTPPALSTFGCFQNPLGLVSALQQEAVSPIDPIALPGGLRATRPGCTNPSQGEPGLSSQRTETLTGLCLSAGPTKCAGVLQNPLHPCFWYDCCSGAGATAQQSPCRAPSPALVQGTATPFQPRPPLSPSHPTSCRVSEKILLQPRGEMKNGFFL